MLRPLVIAALLLTVLAVVLARFRGPAPLPADAAPTEFSATRAHAVLATLLLENVSHPVGSEANRRIRDRVVSRFERLGYQTEVQRAFICSAVMTCATVENIIARRRRSAGPTLAVVAHYDSVAAGPGASDDGANVASLLEVARATRSETFRNDVMFLITDGEEAGLLGADAFAGDPRYSKEVTTYINFENRGTSGPSFLFETSRNNRGLIDAARALPSPSATSLFYTVYENLPNDTDVTIFKAAGKAAVNFGAIGDVVYYHTPLDDLAHVNLRTLQHHGSNALGMVRSLGNADLSRTPAGNATYTDLLGFTLLAWPEWISVILAVTGVFLTAVAGVRHRSYGGRGLLLAGLTLLFSALLGAVCFYILRTPRWVAVTGLATTGASMAGVTAALLAIRLARPDGKSVIGIATVWNLLGLLLVLSFPGASYLIILPGLMLALSALQPRVLPAASAVAAILILPFAVVLYHALGAPSLVVIAVLVALILSTTCDAFVTTKWKVVIGVAAVTLLVVTIGRLLPSHTAQRPRRHTIDYLLDADSGRASWISNQSMKGFVRTDRSWRSRDTWENTAPRLDVASLEIRSERSPGSVLLHVRSPQADRLTFTVENREIVTGLLVNGIGPSPRRSRSASSGNSTPGRASVHGNEAEFEIRTRTADPLTVTIRESTYGLPPSGASLVNERRRMHGVTSHEGDLTVVTRRTTVP